MKVLKRKMRTKDTITVSPHNTSTRPQIKAHTLPTTPVLLPEPHGIQKKTFRTNSKFNCNQYNATLMKDIQNSNIMPKRILCTPLDAPPHIHILSRFNNSVIDF